MREAIRVVTARLRCALGLAAHWRTSWFDPTLGLPGEGYSPGMRGTLATSDIGSSQPPPGVHDAIGFESVDPHPRLHRRLAGRGRHNDSVGFTPTTVARSQGLAGPGRLSMWKGAHRPVLPKRTGRANPPQIPDIDKALALGSSYGTTPTIPRSAGSLQGLGDDKEGGSSDHQPAPAGAGQRHPH